MNRTPSIFLALLLLAATPAPTPLVTGSVRDQTGAPIQGARVTAALPDGGTVTALTANDGTFALQTSDAPEVTIACRFCEATRATVASDGTVTAIVHRYLALANQAPSAADVASLPYAHVESALALRPFVVLETSKAIVPGAYVSDRGSQRGGGLVLDDGIPNYDIVTDVSPFLTIPRRYVQRVSIFPQSEAYRYGDLADGGTFSVDSQSAGNDSSVTGGNGTALRAGFADDAFAASAGVSGSSDETRRRADARARFPVPDGTATLDVTTAGGHTSASAGNALDAAFSGAHLTLDQTRAFDVRTDVYGDVGSYAAHYIGHPLQSVWSDAGGSVTVLSLANVAPFVMLSLRTSSGSYDAQSFKVPRVGATLTQASEVFGVHASGAWYDVLAAVGNGAFAYGGGTAGVSSPAIAQAAFPVLRARANLGDRWSLEASGSGGFRLPSFAERYGLPPSDTFLTYDRDATLEGTLEYTDGARMRAAVTALSRNTTGIDVGRVTSVGASFTWQFSPAMSLRTWWLHLTPAQTLYEPELRFGVTPRPANVGSAWLTYENGAGTRLDVIWRQDLLDYEPDAHLDASLSAPFARNMRWYVGTERLRFSRSVDAGLRFSSP